LRVSLSRPPALFRFDFQNLCAEKLNKGPERPLM
jgi:hypothetical protein